ncbi:unnamed protein product [Caenorhabditis auriculariae]|uniref:Uncharacterized protein n=1 Tax=Caenorhabditis auriculariae TaxID=2777116 RepID=A0A8S1GN63_9PELO|nr:unnamed protein product [Caenorhabditis auriculariae]
MAIRLFLPKGTTKGPAFLDKILRLRKTLYPLLIMASLYYAKIVLSPENMELTRVSEHALMPGLVTSRFDRPGLTMQLANDLKKLNGSKTQQKFVCDFFRELGVNCHEQKWSVDLPSEKLEGRNAYAWVRAPRATGVEAMLVAVRLGSSDSRIAALSHVLSFASYANEQVYWARDIVFVFVDGASKMEAIVGFDAFLSSYHLVKNPAVAADPLHEDGGFLIAATVYEMAPKQKDAKKCVLSAKLNGINGQQPNLDLFNSAVRIMNREHHSCDMQIYGISSNRGLRESSRWLLPIRALYTQAFVSDEGLHSVMGKYGLQGLTIGLAHSFNPTQAAQFMEAMARTLNNALERLHQSYFMYILGDDSHFSSIGFYIPIIILLIVPLLIKAYYEWTEMGGFELPPHVPVAHVFGAALFLWSRWCLENFKSRAALASIPNFPYFDFVDASRRTENVIFEFDMSLVITLVFIVPWGTFMRRMGKVSSDGAASLRMFIVLEAALVLGALSLLNFGLAFSVAVLAVPTFLLATKRSTQSSENLVRGLPLVLCHPLFLASVFLSVVRPLFYKNTKPFDVDTIPELTSQMLREHVLLGSHGFALFALFAVPLSNLCFTVATINCSGLVKADRKLSEEEMESKNVVAKTTE